jgi:hypothetical protein
MQTRCGSDKWKQGYWLGVGCLLLQTTHSKFPRSNMLLYSFLNGIPQLPYIHVLHPLNSVPVDQKTTVGDLKNCLIRPHVKLVWHEVVLRKIFEERSSSE